MTMDIFSLPHLIILLLIVMALFGTSKIKNIGGDLGSAIKSFRQAMKDEEQQQGSPKTAGPMPKAIEHGADAETGETIAKSLHSKS
jgi:sec-independent protein translocase protein TatA